MDPAYVDKLATDKNGLKYLLNGRNLFNKTVEAEGTKAKDSKKTFRAL